MVLQVNNVIGRMTAHHGMWRIFALLLLLFLPAVLGAQQIKLVSGKVLDKNNRTHIFSYADEVYVFAFNTIGAAEDAYAILGAKDTSVDQMVVSDGQERVQDGGYYEIRVADNGYLIFKQGMSKSSEIIPVDGRLNIDVAIDGAIALAEVNVVGISKEIKVMPPNPEINGDMISAVVDIPIPQHLGKSNGRLIIQPFLVDCVKKDTVNFLSPYVYDGEQYHLTQERRMNYDENNDPLTAYLQEIPLTEDRARLKIPISAKFPVPKRMYHVDAFIQMEDYMDVYYSVVQMLTTCRIKRPLRFLEYSFPQYQLDPNEFRVRAKRERRDTGGNISLTFLIGKAELDPDNPQNDIEINKLKSDLMNIINSEGTTLKEFHITGVASPDGGYNSNLALARRRVQYAQQSITSVLPKYVLDRVYQNPQAEVASWLEVAKLLEADSLFTQAAEIRSIVEKNESSRDRQSSLIARLPYYSSLIKGYLPKLRTVRYEYKYEIFRELTPEEIYHRYTVDPDYKSGKKRFALYEYWHLFNMVKDSTELEKLYRDAYDESKKMGKNIQPWILAANNLATSYLRRDTADLSILAPFVDLKREQVNYRDPFTNYIINKEEVVANQLAMYLKCDKFDEASILAQILPDTEKNKMVKAFALCLKGYYRGGATAEEQQRNREVLNRVRESTPINRVVMNLAVGNNVLAEQALKDVPSEKAIYWYLKAIINARTLGEDLGMLDITLNMKECFRRDEEFIDIFMNDGEFSEDMVDYVLDDYQLEKELNAGMANY